MSPRKLATRPVDRGWADGRRRIAQKYAEVAHLIDIEDGAAVNVCVGLCVLAGIAASDAICGAAVGERHSGQDHAAAAAFLTMVDPTAGAYLRTLVELKPSSHYGNALLKVSDRTAALRAADALVVEALRRTAGPA